MINDFRQLLLNAPTINTLVGSRVYVSNAAKGSAMPRCVIHQMDSDEHNDLINTSDLRSLNLDIDCEGATAQDAFGLAAAVRKFLKDYSGTPVSGGEKILAVILNTEKDKLQRTTTPGATTEFVLIVDVDVMYRPI